MSDGMTDRRSQSKTVLETLELLALIDACGARFQAVFLESHRFDDMTIGDVRSIVGELRAIVSVEAGNIKR